MPIALGILAASRQISSRRLHQYEFAGELSLSGELRPIRGALAMSLATRRNGGCLAFILPMANADEAALVANAAIYPATSLLEVCRHFAGKSVDAMLSRHEAAPLASAPDYPDFADVKGQIFTKRALEIAAAGNHSVLLVGPPGSGKTMLASRFVGVLPQMTDEEALEAAAVQSLTGSFSIDQWKRRPFRAPHHTSSGAALEGGGSVPRPGEISLAHRGVLFLDEFPEFDRRVLDVLREPMESGHITISRAARQADFPAQFQLIAAMNPCPCGYHGHKHVVCRCSPDVRQRYQGRISGPLLDRIDIQMEVAAVEPATLASDALGETSAVIAARVQAASDLQLRRQGKRNQFLSTREIDHYCKLDKSARTHLRWVMETLHWSSRAYHRVLRVARTIADIERSDIIREAHLDEAIQYRRALHE